MKFQKRVVKSQSDKPQATFLKLKDGDKVTGIIRGEIHEFWQIWGAEKQVFSKPTKGASSRFKVNFIVYEDGKFVAKIWEFGVTVYNQLADINDVYPLPKTKIRIARTGSTKDNTTYGVLPILNEPLTPAQLKEIEAVPLNILGEKAKNDMPLPWSGDDRPMDNDLDFLNDGPPIEDYDGSEIPF